MREASYSPEFYRFFTVGLRDLILDAYLKYAAKTTFERIVVVSNSLKDKEGYPSIGAPGLPERVNAGEAFPEKKIGDDDMVEMTNADFGEIIAIHENLFEDDQTGSIRQQPTELGNAMRKKEDKCVYSIITGNPTIYDSQAFFSVNHPGMTGGAAVAANDNIYTNVTLSASALAVVIGMIGAWTGATADDDLDVMATDLIVPQALRMAANLLVQSDFIGLAYASGGMGLGATAGQGRNPIKDLNLNIIVSQRLDKIATVGTTDWFVKTDFPGIVHQVRSQLRVVQEAMAGESFERKLLRFRIDKRQEFGVLNWRGMMKVS